MKSIKSLPEKSRRAARRRSHVARDLRTPKYRQRRVEDKKKEKDLKDLSHREFVEMINERFNKDLPVYKESRHEVLALEPNEVIEE